MLFEHSLCLMHSRKKKDLWVIFSRWPPIGIKTSSSQQWVARSSPIFEISDRYSRMRSDAMFSHQSPIKITVGSHLKNSLSSSSRRPKHVKMSKLTLFTERGRCWLIHWDLKLFIFFVCFSTLLQTPVLICFLFH